jgi:hypothetical protein
MTKKKPSTSTRKPEPATLTPTERVAEGTFVLNLTAHAIRTSARVKREQVIKMASALSTDEAAQREGADELYVSKELLRVPEVAAIIKQIEDTRWLIRSSALPVRFLKGGLYLYPVTKVEWVEGELARARVRISELFSALEPRWEEILREDEARLSPLGLFDPADYPTLSSIREATLIRHSWLRFEVPTSLKSISVAVFEAEREKAKAMWADAVDQIRSTYATTLNDFITRLKAAIIPSEDGTKRILRQSVVERMKQFLSDYRLQDVTGFEELATLVDKAKAALDGIDAEVLRTETDARERVSVVMQEISAELEPLVDEVVRKVNINK